MKLIIALLACIHFAAALVVVDSSLASSCIYYMRYFNWGCGGSGQGHAMYLCRCRNTDWVGSVANCMATQGRSNHEITHAWEHLITRCEQRAHLYFTVDQMSTFSTNATQYMKAPPTNKTTRLWLPISVNKTDFKVYRKSFDEINHHVFKSQWFGWGLVLFWGAFIAVHTVSNVMWSVFHVSLAPRVLSQWHQKHMTQETALFALSRGDVLLSFLFVAQTVVSTAVSYTVTLPNVYIAKVYFLTLDLIGYRSALIAFSLMPVVYVFGLRNNPFCYMTGLPQATFIKYHKLVAIVMSLEALIHSAVWTAYAIRSGGYSAWAMDGYWRWGVAGTVLVFVMLGHSIGYFRLIMYEFFVVTHKLFGWLFIVAMWYHCIILGWMGWVYSLIAFTAYDRAVRFFKTFFINRGYTKITANVVDDKIVKISVPKSELHDTFYRPGLHVFISFYHWPIWYQCFQSHPFTIISSPVESRDHFSIYVRVKKGSTAQFARLRSDEKGNICMWLLVEGPYGDGVLKYTQNEQLVGIAGGLGICALLPSFFETPKGSKLFWAISNLSDLDYLRADIAHLIAQGVDLRVFITRDKDEDDFSIEEKQKYVTVLGERPNVAEWVKESVEASIHLEKTNTFILSCGPGHMDRDVQASVREITQVGLKHLVSYKSENYTW